MKSSFKTSLMGYILFLGTIAFNFTVSIMIYASIQDKPRNIIAIIMILCIIISAAICSIVDAVRRRIMVENPVEAILEETKRIADGDFNIYLAPRHIYSKYDEFDLIYENINKMVGELKKNVMLKNDFISNVSHEIKTPLAVIRGYANALKNDIISEEEKKKYLDLIIDASNRLSELVSNILSLNKIENQDIIPGLEEFVIAEAFRECIISYSELIEKKNLELNCEISDSVMIYTSRSYVEIIFNNLLSNAIKFTDEGFIKASLFMHNNEVYVEVSDSGCGISSDVGEKIFDKFYQADTSHQQEGNGLGLAMVKKIIDKLGGEINVSSSVGKGTSFIIKLRRLNDGRE